MSRLFIFASMHPQRNKKTYGRCMIRVVYVHNLQVMW